MGKRRGLSDATVSVALSAIELAIEKGHEQNATIDDDQKLFDARRELTALATPRETKAATTRRTRTTGPRPAIIAAD